MAAALSVAVAEDSKPAFTIKTGVASKYINKMGMNLYDGPVFTSEVIVSYRDFYADVWVSRGLGDERRLGRAGNEVDFGLGWAHQYDWCKVDFRISYFVIGKPSQSYDDRWVVDGCIDFNKVPIVQPYVAVRYIDRLTRKISEGGWFWWVGARRIQPLGFALGKDLPQVKLIGDTSIMFSDGALGRTEGFVYGRLCGSLEIPVTKNVSLVPTVMYQMPSSMERRTVKCYNNHEELVFSGLLQCTF